MYDVNKHHFICGITGSGKTTYAIWEYKHIQNRAIFFNSQYERRVELASSHVVSDGEGFIEAWEDGGKKICYTPHEDQKKATEQLINIKRILFALGKEINKNVIEHEIIFCHLFIDEIQDFSNKDSPNHEVDAIFKQGRRNGVVGIAVSQRPAEVSHTLLVNCSTHIIFRLSSYERGYFDRYKIPIFAEPEYFNHINQGWGKGKNPKDRYHFLVFDLVELTKAEPIKM